jgi:hypothetical protein
MTNDIMNELSEEEKNKIEALEIYKESIDGKSNKEIANDRGLSIRTVQYRLKDAKKILGEELGQERKSYIIDVFHKYVWLYNEAKKEWDGTKDVNFLKEMRANLGDIRRLFSLDYAPKSPVNEQGEAVPEKIYIVINESGYIEAEKREQLSQAQQAPILLESPKLESQKEAEEQLREDTDKLMADTILEGDTHAR